MEIVIIAGYNNIERTLNTVEVFNTIKRKSEFRNELMLTASRTNHGMAYKKENNKYLIFIIGGMNNDKLPIGMMENKGKKDSKNKKEKAESCVCIE